MEQVLRENAELKRKLQQSLDSFDARSIAPRHPDDDARTVRGISDDSLTIRAPGVRRQDTVRSITANKFRNSFRFAFENILEASRVYQKTAHVQECDRSFTSSAIRSDAWSVFTGYSLAQISVLSLIAMPIGTADILNAEYYRGPYRDISISGLETSGPDVELGSPSISTESIADTPLLETTQSETGNKTTSKTELLPRDAGAAANQPESKIPHELMLGKGDNNYMYEVDENSKSYKRMASRLRSCYEVKKIGEDDDGVICRGCKGVRTPFHVNSAVLTKSWLENLG